MSAVAVRDAPTSTPHSSRPAAAPLLTAARSALPLTIGALSSADWYNSKYKELRGVEALPQLEYWRLLPGLVKDGCVFSWQQTRRLIERLTSREREPVDAALKQALADDEGSSPALLPNKA